LLLGSYIGKVPLASIMEMDTDGNGNISKEEYIIYMLTSMQEVDVELLSSLGAQFDLMDTDTSRTLELSDFPPGLALEKTTTYYQGMVQSGRLEVVPTDDGGPKRKLSVVERKRKVSTLLTEFRAQREGEGGANVAATAAAAGAAAAAGTEQRIATDYGGGSSGVVGVGTSSIESTHEVRYIDRYSASTPPPPTTGGDLTSGVLHRIYV
jgi:hypothetical protein